MGKSTRQVQQMLAEVDPEAAAPAERLRPLGDGRWELKAVVDADCQRGLQQLRELLSHVDPHLTVGQLVGRLVREGVERYDPSRPPRRKRRKSDPAGDGCSAETAGGDAGRSRCGCREEPAPGREVRGADDVPVRTEAIREGDGSRHFAGRPASRRRLWGSFAQETPRAAAGQPYFGAEVRCAACRARRERRRCGGDRADFGAEGPRGSRQFDCGSELPRRRIGEADFDGRSLARQPAVSIPEQSTHGAGSAEQTSAAKPRVAAGSVIPQSSRRVGRADFGGEAPRGCRQCDPGAERPRRGIGGADFGGEAWRGSRQCRSRSRALTAPDRRSRLRRRSPVRQPAV